ncbi:MAG: hypothetical protein DI534_09135 [Leifsonia xyli]|nr:MAG: hypothetical protein DI534_09135 [Leifsonia xyli]
MNTTVTPTTRQNHAPPLPPPPAARPARRLSLLDRTALHLGVALIRWGRRSRRESARHERLANAYERALLARERNLAREQIERERYAVRARLF